MSKTVEELEQELAKLKEDVVAKARALSEDMSWCRDVEDAMEELGLLETKEMTVTVMVPFRMTLPLETFRFSSKDPVEMSKELYESFSYGSAQLTAVAWTDKLAETNLNDYDLQPDADGITITVEEGKPAPKSLPLGVYDKFYGNANTARVLHLFNREQLQRARPVDIVNSACQSVVVSKTTLSETSRRGTGQVCRNCLAA